MSDRMYVASLSYGKDSLAMLHVITDILQWPLDRIITADIWATDTIPAELPPMVQFKEKADRIIRERWGITVEHFRSRKSYDDVFYRQMKKGKRKGENMGFPIPKGSWCNSELKMEALRLARKSTRNCIEYIGIAVDEPNRFHNASERKWLPLVEAGWTEQMCREWCEKNDLLSPIYDMTARGGCWFCHNQRLEQLRILRKNYPDLWQMLLKWDSDSPVTFRADGKTVHDYEKRFQWEDDGYIPDGKQFRWNEIDEPQMNVFQFFKMGEST